MKISEVSWAKGYRAKVDAETAYHEVERIRQEHGGEVTPQVVVAASKPKKSALHEVFEWNNTVAADEHRRHQARVMLASIKVTYAETEGEPSRAFALTTIPPEGEDPSRRVYQTMEDVLSDPNSRSKLIGKAIRELVTIREKYRQLQELAAVFSTIDETVDLLNEVD